MDVGRQLAINMLRPRTRSPFVLVASTLILLTAAALILLYIMWGGPTWRPNIIFTASVLGVTGTITSALFGAESARLTAESIRVAAWERLVAASYRFIEVWNSRAFGGVEVWEVSRAVGWCGVQLEIAGAL
jgi:hypothetical protein